MKDGETAFIETDIQPYTFWSRHRLSLLLIISVTLSVGLTVVSMVLYTVSGAAQLDLSRPGYKSVSSQIDSQTVIEEFKSDGSVSRSVIDDFLEQYDAQAEKATAVNAFNGDPLNPELLQLAPTQTNQ